MLRFHKALSLSLSLPTHFSMWFHQYLWFQFHVTQKSRSLVEPFPLNCRLVYLTLFKITTWISQTPQTQYRKNRTYHFITKFGLSEFPTSLSHTIIHAVVQDRYLWVVLSNLPSSYIIHGQLSWFVSPKYLLNLFFCSSFVLPSPNLYCHYLLCKVLSSLQKPIPTLI